MKTNKALTVALVCMSLAVALLAASNARAETKTVSWTNATLNVDGTAIAASGPGSLVRTTVEYGTCNAGKTAIATKSGEINVAAPASALQLPLVVVQEFCLDAWHSNTFATTFAPSTATTVVPGNSVRSNVAVTQSNPPQPGPPGGVTVGSFVAFEIVQAPNKLTLLAFGSVPPGVQCDMAQGITTPERGTLYLVPYQVAKMPNGTPNVTRKTVYAACG